MEQTRQPQSKAFLVLLLILTHATCLIHCRVLPSSPSPSLAPAPGSVVGGAKPRWGSIPATCHSKCNQCRPCVRVEVSIKTLTMQQNEYYPIAWKCMCHNTIFSP
ncbi:hypothetical protein AAHE18_15G111100 [Arachis hypogaea]